MKGKRVTIEELVNRATGGAEPSPRVHLKASWFYYLVTDPWWIWCECHAPSSESVDEEGEYDRLRMRRGTEFEEDWVRNMIPDARTIEPAFGLQALLNTLKAMIDGVRAIHHPQLWFLRQGYFGVGDLIVRVDGQSSDLGEFAYRLVEVKRSREMREYQRLQAAAYHRALGVLQGRTLDEFTMVFPSGEVTVPYRSCTLDLDAALEVWRGIRENRRRIDPLGFDETRSPWRVWGNAALKDRGDLTLLPDVGPAARQKLRDLLMISSIDDLHGVPLEDLVGVMGRKLGASIFHHALAYRRGRAVVPGGKPVTIPRGERTFALDFETSDDVGPSVAQPPHAWLAGFWDFQRRQFVHFLAHGPGDEARMLREMLDYVGDPSDVVVHTWTCYELGVLRGAAGRHPELADDIARFSRACVDLKAAVKDQVCLPVPSYSIKQVAPHLGFRWRHEAFGAFDSMFAYWTWIEHGDDSSLQKALDYHEDDCRAMAHIVERLDGLEGQ